MSIQVFRFLKAHRFGSGDRIPFDSLMLVQDKFTYQIFDLRFKQLTASKKQGTPEGIPFFLVAGTVHPIGTQFRLYPFTGFTKVFSRERRSWNGLGLCNRHILNIS